MLDSELGTEKCTGMRAGLGETGREKDGNNGEQTSKLEKRAGHYQACQIRGRLEFTRQHAVCSLFV